MRGRTSLIVTLFALLIGHGTACGQDDTVPGTITTPYPTLINLSIDWEIQGDDNLNGIVTVRYRSEGAGQWKTGMPLQRIPAGSNSGYTWKNRHAGSLFDLEPDT
ncbi:MAG: hypothetical protein GTO40_08720, partial [Deltaproteobacteria bacterium]|nr:hypothetical protein [Deltaproteobacteria bacterium]